jgi:hypothetical protein
VVWTTCRGRRASGRTRPSPLTSTSATSGSVSRTGIPDRRAYGSFGRGFPGSTCRSGRFGAVSALLRAGTCASLGGTGGCLCPRRWANLTSSPTSAPGWSARALPPVAERHGSRSASQSLMSSAAPAKEHRRLRAFGQEAGVVILLHCEEACECGGERAGGTGSVVGENRRRPACAVNGVAVELQAGRAWAWPWAGCTPQPHRSTVFEPTAAGTPPVRAAMIRSRRNGGWGDGGQGVRGPGAGVRARLQEEGRGVGARCGSVSACRADRRRSRPAGLSNCRPGRYPALRVSC